MLSTALLLLSLSSVSAQLKVGAEYAEFARQVTQKFPGVTVSRGVDHELLRQVEAEGAEQAVEAELALALGELRRFVRVEPNGHDPRAVLEFVKTLDVRPGAYLVVPAPPPGLQPTP